jgi:hypothetical protein
MSNIVRPRGLAKAEANIILNALQIAGTMTIEDMKKLNVRERYICKYICHLRERGHKIRTNRENRFAVSYTLDKNGQNVVGSNTLEFEAA